ncbi:hypothetical protein [Priestia megaterium]|uniref:hypothetical protein n=1 Tax=Priestia megaterium TaxID=1404 RepID=UPI000BF24DAA|nr:hypothetical protein [Priestia megaterium]PFI93401.1 hypothetical protein COI84_19740 [Priestia megaterium]PGR11782.1 hypothetical protein COC62_14260 [Priestia megaterium]
MRVIKWLIGIIVLIFILSVPVFLVAQGMTWKWTSFAPGNTDAWIGFWGGYLGAIIGALAAGAIAYFVAHKQINLQSEKDNKREKQFLATQLRIEKYQEAYSLLAETNREFASSLGLLMDYYQHRIKLEELRQRDDQSQNNIIAFRRRLQGLVPFVEGLDKDLKEIVTLHEELVDVIFNKFTYPKVVHEGTVMPSPKTIPNPRIIEEPLMELTLYTAGVCDKVNVYLKKEIEQLEKES